MGQFVSTATREHNTTTQAGIINVFSSDIQTTMLECKCIIDNYLCTNISVLACSWVSIHTILTKELIQNKKSLGGVRTFEWGLMNPSSRDYSTEVVCSARTNTTLRVLFPPQRPTWTQASSWWTRVAWMSPSAPSWPALTSQMRTWRTRTPTRAPSPAAYTTWASCSMSRDTRRYSRHCRAYY